MVDEIAALVAVPSTAQELHHMTFDTFGLSADCCAPRYEMPKERGAPGHVTSFNTAHAVNAGHSNSFLFDPMTMNIRKEEQGISSAYTSS